MKKLYNQPVTETCKTETSMQIMLGVSINNDPYNGGGAAPARGDVID